MVIQRVWSVRLARKTGPCGYPESLVSEVSQKGWSVWLSGEFSQ